MNLIIATEARFRPNSEGVICSDTGGRGYPFWQRYLDVFDSVTVVGRLSLEDGSAIVPVEGDGVSFFPIPDYVGPTQYLLNIRAIKRRIQQISFGESAFIARVPGAVGSLLVNELQKKSLPYGLEVVGDPYDAFAPGAVKHPLRPFFRWWFSRQLRQQCKKASAIAYVTEYALQRRYPPNSKVFSTHYSSIVLKDDDFIAKPRLFREKAQKITLITVGMLSHLYKAQDVLINAVNICAKTDLDLKLILVGDGKYKSALETQMAALGLGDSVQFLGLLPAGKAVRSALDQADVFVLPSRQEGLPRAIIEAMARGLPCISSTVGGIPELLPADDLVPPDDVNALAQKIREVVTNPKRMSQMSARNLEKAKQYRTDILRERWIEFYQYVKDATIQRINR